MTTSVRLLGPPAVSVDGEPVDGPSGRKGWVVLVHLLLSRRPAGRAHLAALLFPDAADPLAALRWTLADLRRALGRRDALLGDPVELLLGDGVTVDLDAVDGPAEQLLGLGGLLLEGVDVGLPPAAATWLLVERHRLAARVVARVRQEATALLAAGRPDAALPFAAEAVARDPLDEGNHVLLVRCLAVSGDRAGARRQVDVCRVLLRDELGADPSPALGRALAVAPRPTGARPVQGRAAAASQLDAGRAAVSAGAVASGIECLRRAVEESAACGDERLRAAALTALGATLVHAVRGRAEEGSVVLHEALRAAEAADARRVVVTARRELGFVEVQAGRDTTAAGWLTAAEEAAVTDREHAAVLAVRGMLASDRAAYAEAEALFEASVVRAGRGGDARQEAWSLGLLGRVHVLRGETDRAREVLDRSLVTVRAQRWLAFQPLPQVLRAEVALADDPPAARAGMEEGWAVACRLGDPCWEGLAARGLGVLHLRLGDVEGAAAWFDEGLARCVRVTDRYRWMHGHVLEAAAGAALDRGATALAGGLVDRLTVLASRCGLRELLVRAHVHAARLGRPGAAAEAVGLSAGIDNPRLARLVDRHAGGARRPRTPVGQRPMPA